MLNYPNRRNRKRIINLKLAQLSIDRCGELDNNVFNSTIFVVNNVHGFPLLIACSCPIPRG
jgi:hypothetical protein